MQAKTTVKPIGSEWTVYDKALRFFISSDDLRPAMQQCNLVDGKVYATNAHLLAYVDAAEVGGEYDCHPKVPNFGQVLGQIGRTSPLVYDISDIQKAVDKFEKVYDTSPCYDCDGAGSCRHCGAECQTCRGYGEREDRSKPKITPTEDAAIMIMSKPFSTHYMELLVKVAKMIGECDITLIGRSETCFLWTIGKMEVAIARLDFDEIDRFEKVELSPKSSI